MKAILSPKSKSWRKSLQVEKDVSAYNALLDQADALGNRIDAGQALARDMSARVLSGGAGKFGRDSDEVEQLGGKRLSERKRPVRKAKTAS